MKRLELITDLEILRQNALEIKRRVPNNPRFCCVVKADAYGHGAKQTARALINIADAFAVATPTEGEELIEGGITSKPIIALGQISDENDAEASIKYGLNQAIDNIKDAKILNNLAARQNRSAHVHIKVDTGMNRTGVKGEKALRELLSEIKTLKNIEVSGLFTHFCAADEDEEFTLEQRRRFISAKAICEGMGFKPLCHAAASTAMLKDGFGFDMVRAGIALYGAGVKELSGIVRHAQTLLSHPVSFRRVEKGETVGYGRRYTAPRDSLIATIPCGYGDGYPRILSGKADVLINERRAPIVGNVCMDMLMADVTDLGSVDTNSPCVLMGAQGGEAITPSELAELSQTIPYEIMLGFTARVHRTWINE